MDDLIAFLNARFDEDEAAAQAAARDTERFAGRANWSAAFGTIVTDAEDPGWAICDLAPFVDDECLARHIARHDPARVLREVAAKREILDRHMPHQPAFGGPACNWCSEDVDDRPQLAKERWPCPDIRSLAAVWNDHPDYRAEWAP
jgi:hypothetical protein